MDQRYRSRRAELAVLRADLQAKGAPIRQIAHLIRARFNVNSRVAYRYAHGLTQQQVAERWNQLWPTDNGEPAISHKNVSYWEAWPATTGRPPSPEVLNRLARIYRCHAADLLDGEDHTDAREAGTSPLARGTLTARKASDSRAEPFDVLARVDGFIANSGGLLSTREIEYDALVRELIEWACRMKRREILQWLSSAAAAAAAAPVLEHLDTDEQQRVLTAFARPPRVDSTVIEHIEAVLERCRRQDDSLGPQAALETVLAQRNLVRGLLPQTPAALRDRVLSLYAGLSGFAGWLSFDLRNYDAANSYYETGRAAAHEAHDTKLSALILCYMSQLAVWRNQPRVGIDHAVAAQVWAGKAGDLPLRAYAFNVAARAYAVDGQEQATHLALDEALDTLTAASAEEATLVYSYRAGHLASTESLCYLHLGQPEKAAEAAERAITGIGESFVRDLAMVSLRLAISRLQTPRPSIDGAAEAFSSAVRLAAQNRSARLAERLDNGWRRLEPWRDVSAVQEARSLMIAFGLV